MSTPERTALVTGAGRGIGCAVARELAASGCHLVLVGRNIRPLQSTADLIARAGGSVSILAADVCDPSWLSELNALSPRIDVLVNNACAYAPFALVENSVESDFARVHATVVDAARRTIQHVLPGMKERRFGRIVNVGSLAGELGGAGQAAYASAKAALVGLTRTVAVEAARHGVTVNLVQPGLIDTERVAEAVDPRVRERILRGVPARRMGTPEEVACAVAFLASPRSSYITGAVVPVSGGLGLGLFAGVEE